MHPLIEEFVKSEREKGKIYHFNKADRCDYKPIGTEWYFHIMQELLDSKVMRMSEISIYKDKFSIIIDTIHFNVLSKRIAEDQVDIQLGKNYGDIQYAYFMGEPEQFVPLLYGLTNVIQQYEDDIMLIKKLEGETW